VRAAFPFPFFTSGEELCFILPKSSLSISGLRERLTPLISSFAAFWQDSVLELDHTRCPFHLTYWCSYALVL
jgi:hypothetical protein